jgi:hypothetical protein
MPKTGVAFSIVAIAAVIVLFASGPLAATKVQAFGGCIRVDSSAIIGKDGIV